MPSHRFHPTKFVTGYHMSGLASDNVIGKEPASSLPLTSDLLRLPEESNCELNKIEAGAIVIAFPIVSFPFLLPGTISYSISSSYPSHFTLTIISQHQTDTLQVVASRRPLLNRQDKQYTVCFDLHMLHMKSTHPTRFTLFNPYQTRICVTGTIHQSATSPICHCLFAATSIF